MIGNFQQQIICLSNLYAGSVVHCKLITYYVFFISAFIKFIMRYDKNILLDIFLSIEKGSFCLDK